MKKKNGIDQKDCNTHEAQLSRLIDAQDIAKEGFWAAG